MTRIDYPNPSGESTCCLRCGRETKNKSAVCCRCNASGHATTTFNTHGFFDRKENPYFKEETE